MKNVLYILLIFVILLSSFVLADTTFFDNSNDAFIMGSSSTKSQSSTGTSQGKTSQSLSYTKGCKRELEIISPSKISVNQGETAQISVTITNNGTCYLKTINVSLEAPIIWKTQSQKINELFVKKNQTINLEIQPPINETGNYLVKIKALAERVNATKELQINILSTVNNKIITPAIKDNVIDGNNTQLNNKKEEKDEKIMYIMITIIILFIILIIYLYKKKKQKVKV